MLTDAQLIELAGAPAFARARAYRDRVRLDDCAAGSLQGVAHGTDDYPLWLRRDDGAWRWRCACPAAAAGAFCKHLVAAVLVARDGASICAVTADAGVDRRHADTALPVGGRAKAGAGTAPDDLGAFLRAQSVERLATWLEQFADADKEIGRRLRLYRAADDPATLRSAIAKTLAPGGFLDWRGSNRYAQRLEVVNEQLRGLCARDPAAARALCEYALGRLFGIYARSDDSSGAIGDRLRELAGLHAQACAAAAPGKALAKALLALQHKDDWGILALDSYWHALGDDGQRAYGKLVADAFARLPATPGKGDRYGASLATLHHVEAYARCANDFDLLMRVLRWDMSHPHDHQRVVEALREHGREREALAVAESAVKRFPDDARLRGALAGCLRQAGLGDEAVEQAWQAFALAPDEATWDALKQLSGPAWPHWRERSLAHAAAARRAHVGTVELLLHDGDVAAAIALARGEGVEARTLQEVAEHVESDQPAVAAEFYLRVARAESRTANHTTYARVVALLQRARRLAPAAVPPVVAALRNEHARKPKLMALLSQAGL